jgi:predicted metal-dependent HD superfamily phosphohydrolase
MILVDKNHEAVYLDSMIDPNTQRMIDKLRHDVGGWMDDDLTQFVVERYTEPHRYYHTLVHIASLVREAYDLDMGHMTYWPTLSAAIVFHDIIYDPLAKDNETQSAALAALRLPYGTDIDVSYACRMIEATATHMSDDPLTRAFLDLDMGILSVRQYQYIDYARQVRKEYIQVPLDQYVAGRLKFLGSQLDREHIFFHETGDSLIKVMNPAILSTFNAHNNIAMEIGYLSRNPARFLNESVEE